MRMSGILLGGILGATAAILMTRNNRNMMLSNMNWDKAVDKAGQFARSAKSMWDSTSTITANNSNKASASQNVNELDTVGNILAKDAVLKQQVDEIMKESGQPTMQTQ